MFRLSLLLFAAVSTLAAGCRHHGCNDCDSDGRRTLGDRLRDRQDDRRDGRRRDDGRTSDPSVIPPRGEFIPATPLPVTPSRSSTFDSTLSLPPPRISEKPPKTVPADPTGPSNRTLLLPDPLLLAPSSTVAPGILGEPIQPELLHPATKDLEGIQSTSSQLSTDLPAGSPRAPLGFESFAMVPGQDNVASGKKPSLEGLEALKTNGFKTVLYLHAADADLSAAKETVEKRELKFVALQVTSANLGAASNTFAEQLQNATSTPLFVYDADGIRAGTLWYLQFRKVEMLSDEVARIRAGTLGLNEASTSREYESYRLATQEQLVKR